MEVMKGAGGWVRDYITLSCVLENFNFYVPAFNFDQYRVTRVLKITLPRHSRLELLFHVQVSHNKFVGKVHPILWITKLHAARSCLETLRLCGQGISLFTRNTTVPNLLTNCILGQMNPRHPQTPIFYKINVNITLIFSEISYVASSDYISVFLISSMWLHVLPPNLPLFWSK
jgi:hypothetical protein